MARSPFSEAAQAGYHIFPAAHFVAPCEWVPVELKQCLMRLVDSDKSAIVAASLCRGAGGALLLDTAAQRRDYNLNLGLKLWSVSYLWCC